MNLDSRLKRGLAVGGAIAVIAGMLGAAPALAAPGDASISLTLKAQTGTAPFNDTDEPGMDSGPDNDVVRTNDTVNYTLGIRYEGEDQTAPTISFALPKGQELTSLPPFCLDGSSLTPQALPELDAPLTATSWEAWPRQQVVCVIDDVTMGTSLDYPFNARVRPEVPNGTRTDDIVFDVSSDQVTDPASTDPVSQLVSAAAKFDVSKRAFASAPDEGPTASSKTNCAPVAPDAACRSLYYTLMISAPDGGKGVSPLSSPIRITDNLDPASFYGADIWTQMVDAAGSPEAATAAYAPFFAGCNRIQQSSGTRGSVPYSGRFLGDYATAANSVADSGTVSCAQRDQGENGEIVIRDADTRALVAPTTTGTGAALPNDRAVVVTGEVVVRIPEAALIEFGDADSDGVYALETHNEFTDIEMTALDGTPNIGEDPDNNSRDVMITARVGSGFNKLFSGIYGNQGNTPEASFGSSLEGLPGSGIALDGNTVVMAGQSVQSVLRISAEAPSATGTAFSRSYVVCDVWDADRLSLAAHPDWRGRDAALYPSGGEPVYVSSAFVNGTQMGRTELAGATSPLQQLVVEYSAGSFGAGDDCTAGTWSTDPEQAASDAPYVDDEGRTIWPGVNRVRVSYSTLWAVGTPYADLSANIAIGQVVKASASDEKIGNWASQLESNGVTDAAGVIADPNHVERLSTYNPATHEGRYGDRLTQSDAIVRIDKKVAHPDTGAFVDIVPQYTSGTTVDYQLTPTLSTSAPQATGSAAVTVEDCMPAYQVFVSSTQGGEPLAPTHIRDGAPEGSELACDAGEQYVAWELGELPIGQAIEPIIVTAEILDIARNGTYTNSALVSSPIDASPAEVRGDDAQIQLVVPTGIKISKGVDAPLIEVNRDDATALRTMTWSVYFANIDSPVGVSNVDVIDVFPADGLNGSEFTGSLRFDEATVADGDDIRLLYTAAAPANLVADPAHESNAADGSTVWCDAVDGSLVSGSGTDADCPQANGEVTALRMQRAGDFTPDDAFRVDITMTPMANAAGDVYRNITAGRADGVSQGVGPAARIVEVVSSSIGDYVWEDLDGDGIQDADEPGIEGVVVTLTGTDGEGNEVELVTHTDADGRYLFDQLASGTYRVTFDASGAGANPSFTQRHAGEDSAVDSDADPVTGTTQDIELPHSTEDLTLDAGVVFGPDLVTPAEPELTPAELCGEEASVNIPDTEGVVYEQSREGDVVTVTATPEEGYAFPDGAQTEWRLTIPEVEECVTPEPTPEPTEEPTGEPTPEPTEEPTPDPTEEPSGEPTPVPSVEPAPEPTPSSAPEPEPTDNPAPGASETPAPGDQPAQTEGPKPDLSPTGGDLVLPLGALGATLLIGGAVIFAMRRRAQQ